MKLDAEVTGFAEMDDLLRDLPLVAKRRVYRSALSYAGTPILQAAKQNTISGKTRRNTFKKLNRAGSKLGELTLSILTKKAFNPRTRVGDRRIKPYSEKDAFFSVWEEFGKKGYAARQYLLKAFRATKNIAFQRFAAKTKDRMEVEVRKAAKIKK